MSRLVVASIVVSSGLLTVAELSDLPTRLVYNPSASAPIGFYWINGKPIGRGDLVLIKLPDEVRNLVAGRGYLPPDVPLIKRVRGMENDEICRSGTAISINGSVVAEALTVDGSGRKMPVWSGCVLLNYDEIFVLQDHPKSFDGRYFGPIQRDLIIGRAVPLRQPGPS